jgi:pSer/pThr/pTyr-binding forkhead associated (FHA) protein
LGAEVEFPVPDHSLNTPADARGAVTVGATEYRDDSIATYSSRGPTTDGRLKPDISAPAGVSGATYGSSMFDGTSAAAPHVAGAAALVWSAFPELDRNGVATYLTSQALDLGPSGPDNDYGHGRLQLPPAPEGEGESGLLDPTEQPLPSLEVGTIMPTVASLLTRTPASTPLPTRLPAAEAWPSATPEDLVPSMTSPDSPTTLLVGFALLGLCGGVAFLGGTGMLLIARQRARQRQPQPPPISAPSLPSLPDTDYGRLSGANLAPFPLRTGTIDLGRSSENDLVLRSPNVSRRHARIICADGVCTVEDLGSANGTFVNGERVSQAVLKPGSQLRLGDVKLTYDAPPGQREEGAWLEVGGRYHPVPTMGISVGRSSDNDIRLSDELVSRRHANIDRQGIGFMITDLGSTNGTFVNGQPVRQQPLRDGDEIRIGDTRVHFHWGVKA